MPEDQTADGGFKVVDKRPFAIDGTRREEIAETEKKAEPSAAKSKAETKPLPQPKEEDQTVDEGFAMLVEFLANTSFFHLGLVAGPSGQASPVDLPSARAMIDLLTVVQDKTRGNLSPLESKLLSEVLFELHTRFVQAQKPSNPKRK
ncbi:MAG TPA: DUF1844 domain-containing protein [Terriglobia bacterium]|nr:DUF1844 domain-containing protein [Terriglobia bacterium]